MFQVTSYDSKTGKTSVIGEYKLSDFEYDEANKLWTLEIAVGEGQYSVCESAADISGYMLDKVTTTINGVETSGKQSNLINIEKDKKGTIAFKDIYSEKPNTPDNPKDHEVVRTGDDTINQIVLWLALMALACAGFGTAAYSYKKRK